MEYLDHLDCERKSNKFYVEYRVYGVWWKMKKKNEKKKQNRNDKLTHQSNELNHLEASTHWEKIAGFFFVAQPHEHRGWLYSRILCPILMRIFVGIFFLFSNAIYRSQCRMNYIACWMSVSNLWLTDALANTVCFPANNLNFSFE